MGHPKPQKTVSEQEGREAGRKGGKRPLLREEIATLDTRLLILARKRARLTGSAKKTESSLSEMAVKTGCDAAFYGSFFALLDEASFQGEGDAPHEYGQYDDRTGHYEKVADYDRQIMELLSRRQKLLARIRAGTHVPVDDEKFLRENWQKNVTRLGGDSVLAGPLFLCAQGLGGYSLGGEKPGSAFQLYYCRQPVKFCMRAPLDGLLSRKWLYMAAASGQPVELYPVLQNNELADLLAILTQLSSAVTRQEDRVEVPPGAPLAYPDKIINAGSNAFNLFLLVCHYLGSHSRLKITGDLSLQIMDLSFLRHALPTLGARLVHIIPKSSGLPIRIECSGMLPPLFRPDNSVPLEFVQALLLCAPFYRQPFAVDLSACAMSAEDLADTVSFLEQAGASFVLTDRTLNFEPAPLVIPRKPSIPMDSTLAIFLLAMAEACSGEVELAGDMPPKLDSLLSMLSSCGLDWARTDSGARSSAKKILTDFPAAKLASFPDGLPDSAIATLISSLAAIAAANGGKATLPESVLEQATRPGFFEACNLRPDSSGVLRPSVDKPAKAWNAPDAVWAMALGIVALSRRNGTQLQLVNPAIIRDVWALFWHFLNLFTSPVRKDVPREEKVEKKTRRIRTQAAAVLPELREEDWER